MAIAEAQLRQQGIDVRNPLAVNSVDPCLFAESSLIKSQDDDDDDFVGVVTTAQLVYNANPCKLGTESIRSASKKLAKAECASTHSLILPEDIRRDLGVLCQAGKRGDKRKNGIGQLHAQGHVLLRRRRLREYARRRLLSIERSRLLTDWLCVCVWLCLVDACWASFVLIVYLCSDPRGRPLLRDTHLTDLDVQTACAFEAYGRGEVTRRARLRAQQEEEARKMVEKAEKKRRKQSGGAASSSTAPPPPPPAQDDSDSDEWEAPLHIEAETASIANDDDEMDSGDEPDLEAAAAFDAPVEDDWLLAEANADQKVLATKRKRASKGFANASTADSHGILTW